MAPKAMLCTDLAGMLQKTKQLFSLVIKTKLVQNVNRMSERFSDEGLTPKMIDYEKLFKFLFTSTRRMSER